MRLLRRPARDRELGELVGNLYGAAVVVGGGVDTVCREGPALCISDYPADFGLVENWVRLIPWAEEEDTAPAAYEAAAAAEHLATGERADEHQLIGRRYVEEFAIDLVLRNAEDLWDPVRDRVSRCHVPHQFALTRLPPTEAAACAHQGAKELRPAARVEYDQAHAAQDPFSDGGDHGIADIVLRHVTPPGQDVRPLQHLGAEAMVGLGERSCGHSGLGSEVLAHARGDCAMSLWVDGTHDRVVAVLDVLAPDRQPHVVREASGKSVTDRIAR